MNETLSTTNGRIVLPMVRWFPHPVEKVWRAATEPAELHHWFPFPVEVDLRVGGTIGFLSTGDQPATEGRVLELEAPRVFSFTWGNSVLRFELRPEAAGCRMLFWHTFDDRVSAASFAAGWSICFENLETVLAGQPRDVGLGKWAGLHDGFVDQFGLGEGTVECQPNGGGLVHFDRQLTQPAEKVWAFLAGGHDPVVGGPVPPGFTNGGTSAGVVTVVDAPRLVEYDAGGTHVRWELSPGNGGARLALSETVPPGEPGACTSALEAWAARLATLADRLRQLPAGV